MFWHWNWLVQYQDALTILSRILDTSPCNLCCWNLMNCKWELWNNSQSLLPGFVGYLKVISFPSPFPPKRKAILSLADLDCLLVSYYAYSSCWGGKYLRSSALCDDHLEDKAQCKQTNYNKLGLAKTILFLIFSQIFKEACKTLP